MMKIYRMTIDNNERLGMEAISLVEDPAVEVDFLTFNSETIELTKFDDFRHEITGVICLADTPIIRKNEKLGVHYIVFDKDTIRKTMLRYFKDGFSNNINIEHKGELIPGLTMIESYLIDKERNIAPVEFKDVPDGSWIATFKVENDEVWKKIVEEHSLKGFSLQGSFNYNYAGEVKMNKEQTYEEWVDEILEK